MTKVVLKLKQTTEIPTLPYWPKTSRFSENISGLAFSLNILLVFETLPLPFLAVQFSVVSQPFFPFGILDCDSFGCGNALDCLDFCARFAFIRGMLSWRLISSMILIMFIR